jgi:flagellar biosynthetic protein FliQ
LRSDAVVRIAGEAIYTTLVVSAPMLVVALVVGLIISIFQATTQIQEQTLAFVPKIVAVFAAIMFFGPWILTKLVDYTYQLFNNLYRYIQ